MDTWRGAESWSEICELPVVLGLMPACRRGDRVELPTGLRLDEIHMIDTTGVLDAFSLQAPRLHHAARRRGCVAACSTRPAAGDAGDRLLELALARGFRRRARSVSSRVEGGWLHRG